jgi:hypothetical protein
VSQLRSKVTNQSISPERAGRSAEGPQLATK